MSVPDEIRGHLNPADDVINAPKEVIDKISDKVSALTNRRPQVKGRETGFLMLLAFAALYIQIDPRILNGVCQLLARLLIGTN